MCYNAINVTKSTWQIYKIQDFPNVFTILCAGFLPFASTRFLIKKTYVISNKKTCQVPTKRCSFKVAFVRYQLKIIYRIFLLWIKFLLTLALQLLTSHFFVSFTLRVEVALNITLYSLNSYHTFWSRWAHGVLAV